jgi:hypothetical protein
VPVGEHALKIGGQQRRLPGLGDAVDPANAMHGLSHGGMLERGGGREARGGVMLGDRSQTAAEGGGFQAGCEIGQIKRDRFRGGRERLSAGFPAPCGEIPPVGGIGAEGGGGLGGPSIGPSALFQR